MSDDNGYTAGRRRRRMYERLFDWNEARRRAKKGETFASIARDLGVDRRSVARVVKLPPRYVKEATQEQIDSLVDPFPRDKVPCPRCHGPMSPTASLCRDCTNDLRLLTMTTRKVPGSNGLVELRNVAIHRIVEDEEGRAGVVCRTPRGSETGYRMVDYWFEGYELTHGRTLVRVLPTTEVLVGGINEGEEDIE